MNRTFFALIALFLSLAPLQAQSQLYRLQVDSLNPKLLWGAALSGDRTRSVLYRSEDQGKTWQGIRYHTDPANASGIVLIRVHPDRTGVVFVLTDSSGGYLWVSTDGGSTWKNPAQNWPANMTPKQVFVASSPSQLVYVQIERQLRKSKDGGVTFDGGVNTPCDTAIEASPSDPRRLACVNLTDRLVHVSTDEGATWTNAAQTTAGSLVTCTLVNDFQNANLYWGYCFASEGGHQKDVYFRSTDGLKTLTQAPSATGFPLIFVSPDRSLILVTGTSGVVRSRNLGTSWETIGGDNSGSSYGFDPADSNIVYRGGTARSTDGGTSFTSLNPTFVPLLGTLAPLELTLESGTSYEPNPALSDPIGDNFTLASFAPVVPPGVTWASNVPDPLISVAGYTRFVINTAGVAPGAYEASVALTANGLTAGELPIHLQVVARRDPPLLFRAKRLAGTGVAAPEEQGVAGAYPGDGGPATQSPLPVAFQMPLAGDPDGNVYLATRYRVRRIAPNGTVTAFAGSGASGNAGNGGPATQASFGWIDDILWTPDGLLITDFISHTIRRVKPDGTIELFAAGNNTVTLVGGTRMALDSANVLFLATSTAVYRRSGSAWTPVFSHDDIVPAINGSRPAFRCMTIDRSNNSFVLSYEDRIVRRSSSGQVTLLAGTPGAKGFAGDGNSNATGSLVERADRIAVDSHSNVFFGQRGRLRAVRSGGVLGTVAGDGHFVNPLADNAAATSGSTDLVVGVNVTQDDQLILAGARWIMYRLEADQGPTPQLTQGAVVSLAAGLPRIGQGAIFSLYGTELSGSTESNTTVPLPLILAGVQVVVNDEPVPLFYVSPLQINAQMPYETPPGAARVRIVRGGRSSAEVTAQVVAAGPDILQYGEKRAVAVNADGSINRPGDPAAAGSVIVLYLTGIGPVTPPTATGAGASATELSVAALSSRLTLNGREVRLAFLGLSPGFVGLAQANIELPADLAPGDYTLILTVDGVDSNPVFLNVGP